MIKSVVAVIQAVLLVLSLLCGCATDSTEKNETFETEEITMKEYLLIDTGKTVLRADFADTKAAEELKEMLRSGNITVTVSDYGGWEKVGGLPERLSTDDFRQTAKIGDIMLYNGSQIVLFYGENVWEYTKLAEILGDGENTAKVLSDSFSTVELSITEDDERTQ